MKTDDFDFYLPEELIAQYPLEKRDNSKLLVLNREDDTKEDKHFYDILDYLNEVDTLVLNNSKVIMSRLFGKKETGAKIELFLLKHVGAKEFEALIKPLKRVSVGTRIILSEEVSVYVRKKLEDGLALVEFDCEEDIFSVIEKIGSVPLPHYIKGKLKDKNRYQTVYSKHLGSSAAPTAGLHFTNELLKKIEDKGVNLVYVTLHVGLGTFRPVKVEDVEKHTMHSEYCEISNNSAKIINETIKNKKRVIAVGTTSVRTLESCYKEYNEIRPCTMDTSIFIYPPYKFKVVDALITNFHLPKSTLLMLISAFYDKEKILSGYNYAVENEYRFFSFGDSMLIL